MQKDTNKLKKKLDQKIQNEVCVTQMNDLEPLMQKCVITFSNLEILYDHLKNLDELARKFGYPTNNNARLEEVAHIIQHYQASLELIEQGQDQGLFAKFKAIKNTILELAEKIKNSGDITEKDYHELIDTIEKGNFKITFAGEQTKDKCSLQSKLHEADGLLNTIKQWLEKIKASFISLSAHINTLFHLENSYELPAIKQTTRVEPSP